MRDILQEVLDEFDDREVVHLALLIEFEFSTGTENLWAGPEGHQITYDSRTWTALGEIGSLDKIAEGQGLTDSRINASLRIDSENVSLNDIEDSRGRNATITLLVLSAEGAIIGPIDFRTTMGAVSINPGVTVDETGRKNVTDTVNLELLSETASLEQNFYVRMTYDAGRRIDSTDHGLEFVADPEIGNIGLGSPAGPERREDFFRDRYLP